MVANEENRWRGLRHETVARLKQRDYAAGDFSSRAAGAGVDAAELLAHADPGAEWWIPGFEIFPRKIFRQRHRGFFGELAREHEGLTGRINMWPRQWAAAAMFAGSAKGFHIHPPHIPEGQPPEAWFRRLYVEEPENFSLRPYAKEQWDLMFFLHGVAEVLVCDQRAGLPARQLRMFIDGDNHRGANNAAILIPPGVAHALRAEGDEPLIMAYGTSTTFNAAAEGRIASDVETAPLPPGWDELWKTQRKSGG